MEDTSRLNCATIQGGEEQKACVTNMTSVHMSEARCNSDEVGRWRYTNYNYSGRRTR
jgi:hypothetical protein